MFLLLIILDTGKFYNINFSISKFCFLFRVYCHGYFPNAVFDFYIPLKVQGYLDDKE